MSNPQRPHILIPYHQVTTTQPIYRVSREYIHRFTSTDLRTAMLRGWMNAHVGIPNRPAPDLKQVYPTYSGPSFLVAKDYVEFHGEPIARIVTAPTQNQVPWLLFRRYYKFFPTQRSILRHLMFGEHYMWIPDHRFGIRPETILAYNMKVIEESILKIHRARKDPYRTRHKIRTQAMWNRVNWYAKDYHLAVPELTSEIGKIWVAMQVAQKLEATPSF